MKKMKKMKIVRSSAAAIVALSLIVGSCKESVIGPQATDSTSPSPPSNIVVTNTPGGAVISYTLPAETDIQGVEAQYKLASGKVIKIRSSKFTKQITVFGFAKSDKYTVTLSSVDNSGNYSPPVSVEVNPLTPPVESIFKSLSIAADYGGFSVVWKNESKVPVALLLFAKDQQTPLFNQIDAVYTSVAEGDYTTRGLKSEKNRFGVIVRDQYENYSDTLFAELTPLEESKLDPRRFRPVLLPTDRRMGSISQLWDGNIGTLTEPQDPYSNTSGLPHHFTFSLGVTAKISRFKIYQYNWGPPYNLFFYNQLNARFFEVWGATDPSPDGSWVGWTLLKDVEIIKPSGLPIGQSNNPKFASEEDIAQAIAGHEFKVSADAPPVRYIRIKSKKAWMPTLKSVAYGDIEIFGQVVSE